MATADERTYQAAVEALYNTQVHGDDLRKAYSERKATMEAMRIYLKRLGLDDECMRKLPVLHVTGSKGKGSTCAFVESILRHKGIRTVLFTSPHLVRVNERIRVNGKPLSNEQWTTYFWSMWDRLKQHPGVAVEPPPIPGYFRLLTLLCFWVAIKEKTEVLILEVGVGGRFDATNVVPCPIACAITTLDLEHTDLLGPTFDDIAWEKGGLMKARIPCFVSPQEKGGLDVLKACAEEVEAPFYLVEPLTIEDQPTLGIAGDFQRSNAALAVALVYAFQLSTSSSASSSGLSTALFDNTDLLSTRGSEWLKVSKILAQDAEMKQGLEQCHWPGRCQRLHWGPHFHDNKGSSPIIKQAVFFIDGAHTDQSMKIAVKWYDEQHQEGKSRALLFNCGEEKFVPDLLQYLIIDPFSSQPRFDVVVFCPASSSRPTLAHSRPARGILGLSEEREDGSTVVGKEKEKEKEKEYVVKYDVEKLKALCTVVEEEEQKKDENWRGEGMLLSWQHNLCNTWRILQAHHELLSSSRDEVETSLPLAAREAINRVGWTTRTMVVPCIDEALKAILKMDDVNVNSSSWPAEILVTGSLYLVGNLLQRVEEDEEEREKGALK